MRCAAIAALARVGLGDEFFTPTARLSAPERARVLIAAAYATGAQVLLLDEPSAGGSAQDRELLVSLVRSLRDEGLAVLLVEHDLRLVRAVADSIVVLDAGTVVAQGPPEAVAADPRVRAIYLGGRT